MKRFTFVFEYSDTYGDDGFPKARMEPTLITFKISDDNLSDEAIYKRVEDIHYKILHNCITRDLRIVKEGEGYDWYNNEGKNAFTLSQIVCRLTGWTIPEKKSVRLFDIDEV